MNYLDVIKSIDHIIKIDDNLNDNNCILVNGEWGIGKTYAINQWIKNNNDVYNIKYISVFGKSKARDIENAILIKLAGLVDIKAMGEDKNIKSRFNLMVRGIGDVTLQALSNKTGIAFEAAEYVKNISVEEFSDPESKGKKTIICIDDLERKSDIKIVDLLGLIERTTQNYDVIVIANTKQLSPDDKVLFDKYREKVIDYEFVINKIDPELQRKIAADVLGKFNFTVQEVNLIAEKYNKPFKISKDIALTEELYNIRVFKKYVLLIHKVFEEITNTLNINDYKLDTDIIGNCKSAICRYYFSQRFQEVDEKGNKSIKLRDGELIEIFRQIFMGENFDVQQLRELVSTDSEVTEDIKKIYSAYRLRREEVNELFSKVQEKIMLKDNEYFATQHKIISMYDAFISYGHSNDFYEELLEIASLLYKPEASKDIPRYDSDEWFDVGFWGGPIPCSQKTASFIKLINRKNTEIYRKYKTEAITKAITEGNVDATIKIISDIIVANKLTFNKIFELGWGKLDGPNHENGWKLLYKLINRSDNKLTQQFFDDYDTSKFDDMQNMRFKHLIEVFEENEYYREQAEEATRRQYEEQFEKQ